MRIAKLFFKGLGRFLHSHEQWELGGLSVVRRKWALCAQVVWGSFLWKVGLKLDLVPGMVAESRARFWE